MTNKKRIRALVFKKYKRPEFDVLQWPTNLAKAIIDWKKVMNDSAIHAQNLGNKIELVGLRSSNIVLSNYRVIPTKLPEPSPPLFSMEKMNYQAVEPDNFYINNAFIRAGRTEYLKDQLVKQVSRMQNDALSQYLRKNLELFGYTFDTETDFLDFAKGRITRISFPGDVTRFEYYLDFGNENGGDEILIGISNNKIEWTVESNRVTITVG